MGTDDAELRLSYATCQVCGTPLAVLGQAAYDSPVARAQLQAIARQHNLPAYLILDDSPPNPHVPCVQQVWPDDMTPTLTPAQLGQLLDLTQAIYCCEEDVPQS